MAQSYQEMYSWWDLCDFQPFIYLFFTSWHKEKEHPIDLLGLNGAIESQRSQT